MPLTLAVNWNAVTAIATCVLAVGLLGGFAAALFTAQQVRESRRSRNALMAVEFFRRWNEGPLVEARSLASSYGSPEELRQAFVDYVATDAPEAYVLHREPDFFEQVAALESIGDLDLELIKRLLGRTLAERWKMWEPAIRDTYGPDAYPLFKDLARKLGAVPGTGTS